MKSTTIILLTLFIMITPLGIAACSPDNEPENANHVPTPTPEPGTNQNPSTSNQLQIKVGTTIFNATLVNNDAATAFKTMLPMTVNMSELNRNEKYYQLPSSIPTNASRPGTIQTGDLMIWGSNTLVLFYKTFSTSYSYTNLGRIDNPEGLEAALGSGNVTITFEQQTEKEF